MHPCIRVPSRLLWQESSRPNAVAVGTLGERSEMGSDGADVVGGVSSRDMELDHNGIAESRAYV